MNTFMIKRKKFKTRVFEDMSVVYFKRQNLPIMLNHFFINLRFYIKHTYIYIVYFNFLHVDVRFRYLKRVSYC